MYCLDTDTIIEYLKGNNKITAKIDKLKEKISLTPLTMLELFYGAYLSENAEESLKQVKELLEIFNILKFDVSSYDYFGRIKTGLKKEGKLLDNFDLTIASLAIANNKILVTSNTKHFERIKALKIENWLK